MKDRTINRSAGKGMSFFISTDDSQIIIKTLKSEEMDLLLDANFLSYYLRHLEDNPNSLVCRIYGVYNVITDYYNQPIFIMLLRDARGPFKKVFIFYLST
jgi:1-phosphatidylinositol-4-phosphate 5-kinase